MLFWFLTEGLSQLYKHSVDWNCNNSQQMAFPRGWLRLKGESPHFKFSAPCELTGLWVGGNDYLRLSSAENFALQQGWRDVGQGIKASTLGTERATVGWGEWMISEASSQCTGVGVLPAWLVALGRKLNSCVSSHFFSHCYFPTWPCA